LTGVKGVVVVELRTFASKCENVRWIDDNRYQAECPICRSSHGGTDSDRNLIARLVDDHIKLVCFAGHNQNDILEALGSTPAENHQASRPQPQTSPPPRQERPQTDFSTERDDDYHVNGSASPNGKPRVDPVTWKIIAYRIVKGILEHDCKENPELLASASADMLVDGAMKDLRRGLAAGKLNPLPDLNETELDEEMQAAARAAVKEFVELYGPKPKADPRQDEEEEYSKINALNLDQLYQVIDEWDRQPWVWSGILPHSSLSLIVGKSETGKSTLIYSLIYSIVTGTEFLGRQCEQGRVLYLAGDPMSEIVAGKIFRELGLSGDVVRVVPDALVMHPTGMQQLRGIVAELKPCLVVGDTLAATVDLDVDKYGQSYKAQMPLTKLAREFGPNFAMSHHSQKSAMDSYGVIDAALGSVGVAAVASTRMATKLYRRKGQKFYTFEMSNLRIGQPLEGEFIIHKLENGLVELGGLWKLQNTEMDKKAILEVLSRQTQPMAKRTLWQELRPKPKWDPFNDAIEELFAAGEITIKDGPRGGKMFSLRSV
jgi:hypothetical protein